MKIGILGGTFDPIHFGHLRTAEEIGQGLGLHKVYLIPAASPPHKTRELVSSFPHRMAMVRLGVQESSMLDVLDLEGRRPGLSYSYDTLRQLKSLFGGESQIYFLVGSDAFLDIRTWKDYRRLFHYAHFVIVPRHGNDIGTLKAFISELDISIEPAGEQNVYVADSGNRIIIFESTLMDISGTHIRHMVGSGKSIAFLVPHSVRAYILKKGLYRPHENA